MVGWVGPLIAAAWTMLIATAYVARLELHMGRSSSVASVGVCYLVLVVTTFFMLGFVGRGAIAAPGLVVPALVASALVLLLRSAGA